MPRVRELLPAVFGKSRARIGDRNSVVGGKANNNKAPTHQDAWAPETFTAHLTEKFQRPTFFPAVWREGSSDREVAPLAWRGSADLRTLGDANCLIAFPPGAQHYTDGPP